MEMHISEIVKIFKPKPLVKQNRTYWIYKFIVHINDGRYEQDKYDIKRMGRVLKRYDLWELPVLYKLCEQAKNFNQYFWWHWKQKPAYHKPKKPKQLDLKIG